MQQLENEFITGYRDGDWVFHVSMYNDKAKLLDISSNISDFWSGLWRFANNRFEAELAIDLDLAIFSGNIFYVWEGNHRLPTWWRHINNFHDNDKIWLILVHCMIFDPQNKTDILLDAMNDIT